MADRLVLDSGEHKETLRIVQVSVDVIYIQ